MKILDFSGIVVFCLFLFFTNQGISSSIDLADAEIVNLENDAHISKAVEVLQEEIQKRTGIAIRQSHNKNNQAVIIIGLEDNLKAFPEKYQLALEVMPAIHGEGFKLLTVKKERTILIAGKDARGVLYGIGKLLQKMEMRPGEIKVPSDLKISTSPRYPIRGHQLGYRPKTNAYDAWTPAVFDQYIRDLALFGANSIEIMPPRTDDIFSNNLMPLPAIEMIKEQSRICDSYGLDVWMWYPNMGENYSHPDSIQKELEERREVFQAIPRLNHLFVPGGDPGDLHPEILFAWLDKIADVLHEYHPTAKIWVSPQVFRPEQAWFDAFFAEVNEKHSWFGGVVFGPWVKIPIREIRKLVDSEIPIRRYPDITHSLSSQYPVPDWDLAFAMTLGRECINPRPEDEKIIHNAFDKYAQGSISYSEGINDDVNKFLWSGLDWDPDASVTDILEDYSRYFIGPDYADPVAQGLIALEENFKGPLQSHPHIMTTLHQWQDMERNASKSVLKNYRFQLGLIRAYYDAYIFQRLNYEKYLEQQALNILSRAKTDGAKKAIAEARTILEKASHELIRPDLRQRCHDLADSLFHSIGMQLSIEKHQAAEGRGNFLDNIDIPLNNAPWLLDQFSEIENQPDEAQRLHMIKNILEAENPSTGGIYDNFGSAQVRGRIITPFSWEEDPGNLQSPAINFGVGLEGQEWVHEVKASGFQGQAAPVSWMSQITTLYDQPLQIEYTDLDPDSDYTIRVAYTGRFPSKIKMSADGILVHDFIQTGRQPYYEFKVPEKALSDGKVIFEWTCGEGERGTQIAEVWLMKNERK